MPQPNVIDIQTFVAQQSSGSALPAQAQIITALGHDLEKQRQLREGKPVGHRYEGVEVMVAWQGPLKGTRGVVVGDLDSPARALRLQRRKHNYPVEDHDGVMVTVQKEGSNMRFTLDIQQLVHLQYVSRCLSLSLFETNFEVPECRS